MQQLHGIEVTIYADITEVRMETRVAECKKLLADGWVLLGVYPLTGEPTQRTKDTPRYVQCMASYVMGRKRE